MMLQAVLDLAPAWLVYHAPALLVVIPLLLAPICAILPSGRLAWAISIAGSAGALICAMILAAQVRLPEVNYVSYAMGGWQPPLGIEFRIDALNSLILLIVAGIGLLASIFSWPSVAAEVRKE